MAAYDSNNIFAKILRGEIPCDKLFENEHALAFSDINPQAPAHALVIPKGSYVDAADFAAGATAAEVAGLFAAVGATVAKLGLAEGGWRLIANCGSNAHQEVPHLHFHIVGGRDLGAMLPK
ncbi:MAG: HIT domain-containing protein [Betaproteobacteria bacterium]|nr:HIT domain-containing protein [Betaproteobacteria bacterium]